MEKKDHPWWYVRNILVEQTGTKGLVSPLWHVRNIVVAWAASWVWVMFMQVIFRLLFFGEKASSVQDASPIMSLVLAWADVSPSLKAIMLANPLLAVFVMLICAPFFEEGLFRVLPLTLVRHKNWDVIRAVSLVVCGIVFGWAHGSQINVFFQGFGGVMLAWVYLRNRTTPLAGYLSAVAVHFMYNFTVVATFGLGG